MKSKIHKNSQFFNFWTLLIICIAILPQNSIQQELVAKSNVIEAHCMFSYDTLNRYNCYLFNIRTTAPNDILEFTGAHLPNHTDTDVHGVLHTNSQINRFNGEALRRFPNLRRLSLMATFLQSINPTAFDICGQLEELDIGINFQLLALPPRMLANCGNLRIFTATNSRFQTIPEDLFGSTTRLEVFNLAFGRLTSIPDNLLRNMSNLRRFLARNSQLTHISPTNFFSAVNLEEIDLFFNDLNNGPAVMNLLNGHFGLRRIILNHNLFTMFNLNFFAQFSRLEELGIGGRTNLTDIAWQFLPSSLKILSVYSINEEIPENALFGLPNLTFLKLTGHGITTLQPDIFSPLINLNSLDISNTRITSLHPQIFASQRLLTILHLNDNQIEVLPDGIFEPLGNLGANDSTHGLMMFGNKLRRLSANSFGQHPHLNYIFLSHNQIYAIQRGLFSRFNPRPALISFLTNECIDWTFIDEENLDEHEKLEKCFNNYDGIENTTPGGAMSNFRRFEIFVIIFFGFFGLYI